MSYLSLFDTLIEQPKWYETIKRLTNVDTNLDNILKDLYISNDREQKKISTSELSNLILNGARIIRGTLAYKCINPCQDSIDLLKDSVNLVILLYSGNMNQNIELNNFRKKANFIGGKTILKQRITQRDESIALSAIHPKRSQQSAEKILEKTSSLDIDFYPIANGGIMTGLDVYLRYLELSGSKNSKFYPIRFSRKKEKDDFPRLTDNELNNIRLSNQYKTMVLYDEDKSTGETFIGVKDFLQDNNSNLLDILEIANVNGKLEQTVELLNPEYKENNPLYVLDSNGCPINDEFGNKFNFDGFNLVES